MSAAFYIVVIIISLKLSLVCISKNDDAKIMLNLTINPNKRFASLLNLTVLFIGSSLYH